MGERIAAGALCGTAVLVNAAAILHYLILDNWPGVLTHVLAGGFTFGLCLFVLYEVYDCGNKDHPA